MYRKTEMSDLLEKMRKIPLEKTKKVEEQLPRHHSAPQTMKPQEKPEIDAETHHMEDYSEEDLEKAKDKGKETGHTLREPKEDELKVEPKKESKLKEQKDVKVGDVIRVEDLEDNVISPASKVTTVRDDIWRTDTYQVITTENGGDTEYHGASHLFVKESKLKEEDEGWDSLKDEALITAFVVLGKERDGKLVGTSKDLAAIFVELKRRGLEDKALSRGSNESKQTKKGKQLYLCNECFKTFRANESICTHCQSENVERIVLQEGEDSPGERDGTGPAKSSYQKRKYGDKGKRKQAGEECPFEENKVEEDYRKITPGLYQVTFYDGTTRDIEADSMVDAKTKTTGESAEKKVTSVKLLKQLAPVRTEENKIHETVQELVGEVDGIDRIDQHLLNKAIESGVIPNQFPELEVMIDELSAADVAKDLGVKDIDDVDIGDIDAVYLKYILLPKAKEASRAARESNINEVKEEKIMQRLRDYIEELDGASLVALYNRWFEENISLDDVEWVNSESKLKEEEEKDSFKTVAKGIEDKDTADKLAAEKEGQVVADEEDDKKFAVIKRVEK